MVRAIASTDPGKHQRQLILLILNKFTAGYIIPTKGGP
jgi:hypothetical protein